MTNLVSPSFIIGIQNVTSHFIYLFFLVCMCVIVNVNIYITYECVSACESISFFSYSILLARLSLVFFYSLGGCEAVGFATFDPFFFALSFNIFLLLFVFFLLPKLPIILHDKLGTSPN